MNSSQLGFPHEFDLWIVWTTLEHFEIDPLEHIDIEEVVREYHYEPEYMDE